MAEQKASAESRSAGFGLANVRLAVVKRAKAVALLPIIAALATLAIVALIPDRYAASVLIQIDPRPKPPVPSEESTVSGQPAFEAERLAIDQQIEVLRSPSLVDRVVEDLHLGSDPEFQTRPAFARIIAPIRNADPEIIARETLAAGLTIQRVRNSFLINVRFASRDAAKAAMIANAIAAQYIAQGRAGASNGDARKTRPGEPTASEKVFASLLAQYGPTHTLSGARIVEGAQVPRQPAGPKRMRIVLIAAASTLALMLAIAVLLERDARLRTRNVEQMLACPHMTSLPAAAPDDASPMSARRARLVIAEPACRYADAVRAACRELAEHPHAEGARVILVTSALPGEGAELFASNIAHHLAMAGQTSLLVDCDFHSKGLTHQLTPDCRNGLLDQIAAHAPVENVILRDSLTGVHFLPASGPAPIALPVPATLRSVEFAAAFQHLKARFQTIVVSAPPLLEVPDAQALADLADQIVFLTAWHRTPRALAKKALALLDANQRKLVGAVLADISDDRDAGFMSFAAMFDEIRRAARIPALDRAA